MPDHKRLTKCASPSGYVPFRELEEIPLGRAAGHGAFIGKKHGPTCAAAVDSGIRRFSVCDGIELRGQIELRNHWRLRLLFNCTGFGPLGQLCIQLGAY